MVNPNQQLSRQNHSWKYSSDSLDIVVGVYRAAGEIHFDIRTSKFRVRGILFMGIYGETTPPDYIGIELEADRNLSHISLSPDMINIQHVEKTVDTNLDEEMMLLILYTI